MPDARFASIKTDPRFRRPRKHQSKVVLDDRFKDLLGSEEKGKKGKGKKKQNFARVDKYGRAVSETQEKDNLRRFYTLETAEDGGEDEVPVPPPMVDYARGAVLMESSDEEEGEQDREVMRHGTSADDSDSDSDQDGFVTLGPAPQKPEDDEDIEIDLDENTVATLDAQVAEYAKAYPELGKIVPAEQTRRLAVVNLDWDHVRAVHLYKIFSSLVSPTAPLVSSASRRSKSSALADQGGINIARGRILSVRVYPSEFGKSQMAKEEKEGPPTSVFKKTGRKKELKDEEINEKTIIEIGNEADYDENALRKYQLERLRYYYAIVECDTVEAAVHAYNELEGTELERSANQFDLSFVPDDMTFDDEPRDEATRLSNAPYRAVEFTTDALRHSKVKLTWDEDDPERVHILRRPLSKKEVEEADFRAYIASSSSSEEGSDNEYVGASDSKSESKVKSSRKAERDKLRMLLLGGNDEGLPEGWGDVFDNKTSKGKKGKVGEEEDSDVDMEVTFTPGLVETKDSEDETTLDRYRRKMKEKRKKKKEEARTREQDDRDPSTKTKSDSVEFFGVENDSQLEGDKSRGSSDQSSKKHARQHKKEAESSNAELVLLAASDSLDKEPAHFDMKAVLKKEKQRKSKKPKHQSRKSREAEVDDGPGETQDDFVIDVKDERFAAVHEDHQFAIDPTHPQYKKTKSMAALLDERSKRQKSNPGRDRSIASHSAMQQNSRSLQSLMESVKRKSGDFDRNGLGKRRKLGKS